MYFNALNGMLYTLGWFWCIWCGLHGQIFLALAVTALSIYFQLRYLYQRNRPAYYQDLFLVVFATLAGFTLETLILSFGLLQYHTQNMLSPIFPPGWILALYPLFGMTFNHSLKPLTNNIIAAGLLGGLGGPLCYLAGSKLGALNFLPEVIHSIVIIGILWAGFMCLLFFFNRKLREIIGRILDESEVKQCIAMLYDGDCPLCKREVSHLKKNTAKGKVDFVDIADENYRSEAYRNISYAKAMEEIHAIDSRGNILKGTEAFTEIYARTGHTALAIILQLPLLKPLMITAYKLFAKYRLQLTGRTMKNKESR